MVSNLYAELPLTAQTAFAELVDETRSLELDVLAGLKGSFSRRTIRGHSYVYFGYRDVDGRQRMSYVGPANERVNALVAKFGEVKAPRRLAPQAQAAAALGNAATLPKHFRVVRQLAAYGFFRAGGVLIGTHAFVAMANMLGVRWADAQRTQDVDFAHAGKNVSVALPADLRLSVHDALTSLEMGLLPISEFSGKTGAQYRNPADPELRLDFVTAAGRGGSVVVMDQLGLALEPLKFMEFSLEGTTQTALFSREGACLVNIPAPERYAVHKLIVHGERPVAERGKAVKDLAQAAALAQWYLGNAGAASFNTAWRDALGRGKGWRQRAIQGRDAMLTRYPFLDRPELWADSPGGG
ncbi:MAG: nucleotidyltransferase domain-containing protein [Burkholderiaceae bacterium]